MINSVTYNGINSLTKGVFVSGQGTFNAAELDFTRYEIPGRNGDFIVPKNRYKNIEVAYPAFIPGNFKTYVNGVREWMRSTNTYAEILDTYDTAHYRMGLAIGELEFEPVANNRGANFQLVFDCKPQRWLVSGKQEAAVADSWTGTNPTKFTAKPLFKITGIETGTEVEFYDSVSQNTYVFTALDDYAGEILIDSETQNVHSALTNQNDLFDISGGFPEFSGGCTAIVNIAGTFGTAKIVPRWWEL